MQAFRCHLEQSAPMCHLERSILTCGKRVTFPALPAQSRDLYRSDIRVLGFLRAALVGMTSPSIVQILLS